MEIFECALNFLEGDDLAKILWHKSSSAEIWLDRRSNYTRSLAVMSMVNTLIGFFPKLERIPWADIEESLSDSIEESLLDGLERKLATNLSIEP